MYFYLTKPRGGMPAVSRIPYTAERLYRVGKKNNLRFEALR